MKMQILDKTGKASGSIEMPRNFSYPVRQDIIQKVFESEREWQPFGNYTEAGKRHSASSIQRRKRHSWKSSYGKGAARTPRKIMSRDGSSFNLVGAEVANTRGGRRAHPPKSWENMFRKINKKELIMAMNSALSATINRQILEKKYNREIMNVDVVFSHEVLKLKTKDFIGVVEKAFGVDCLMKVKKQRAGMGKARGRRYKSTAGLLFVLGNDEEMKRKGIDVVHVKDLKMKHLAPAGQAGRFAAYTEKAIKQIEEKFK